MNYRKNSGKLRRLTALCAALAVFTVGFGTWAVVSQLRVARLSARIAELEASSAPANASASAAVNYDPDAIVAEFDGGVVTAGEAMEEYQTLASYYQMLGVAEADYAEEAKTTVLDGLVETKLLEQKAESFGLTSMTDAEREEIEAQAAEDFEANVNYYMAFRTEEGKSEEDARAETLAYLEESGYTLESVIEEAVRNAWQQRLYAYVTKDMTLDEEQMRAFYEEQVSNAELTYTADFHEYELDVQAGRTIVWNPEGVRRVQTILIPFDSEQSIAYLNLSASVTEGDTSKVAELDALYASLEPQAQKVLDRLNAGENYETLAAEYGGYGPSEGSCVGEQSTLYGSDFRNAALALENIGDISGIVRSDGGLCILRYAGDVNPGAVPYEQVADQLREGYQEELKMAQYNATIVQWLADANVQYYPERF